MAGMLERVLGQSAAMTILKRMLDRGHIPPALIFSGPVGVGKRFAARAFGVALSCEKKTGCGVCPACKENDFGEGLREIDIAEYFEDQKEKNRTLSLRRELASHATARATERFAVIIENADRLNESMQAALLKSIEEPVKGVCYILIVSSIMSLSATIRSRALAVKFRPLDMEALTRIVEEITEQKLDAKRRALVAISGGSVSAALRLIAATPEELAELASLAASGAKGGKTDRASLLEKLLLFLPVEARRNPEIKEDLVKFDEAVAGNAYIPLATEVFRRRASSRRRPA